MLRVRALSLLWSKSISMEIRVHSSFASAYSMQDYGDYSSTPNNRCTSDGIWYPQHLIAHSLGRYSSWTALNPKIYKKNPSRERSGTKGGRRPLDNNCEGLTQRMLQNVVILSANYYAVADPYTCPYMTPFTLNFMAREGKDCFRLCLEISMDIDNIEHRRRQV